MLITVKYVLMGALIISVPGVMAQELASTGSLGSYSWEAIKVLLSLMLVLIIFYLIVNAFKKYTGISVKNNASIHVIGGLSLGGKDKVVILKVGQVDFLIGVSSGGIRKIHQFAPGELDYSEQSAPDASDFSHHIDKLLHKDQQS